MLTTPSAWAQPVNRRDRPQRAQRVGNGGETRKVCFRFDTPTPDSGDRGSAVRNRVIFILDSWLPIVDAFRTFAVCPPPAVRAVFQRARELAAA